MGYSRAQGNLIHEKKKSKNSCHSPFKYCMNRSERNMTGNEINMNGHERTETGNEINMTGNDDKELLVSYLSLAARFEFYMTFRIVNIRFLIMLDIFFTVL